MVRLISIKINLCRKVCFNFIVNINSQLIMFLFPIILLIVAVIVAIAFLAPKSYEVKRSIIIDKPHSGVFNYLKYCELNFLNIHRM